MGALYFTVCVTGRSRLGKLNTIYKKQDLPVNLITLGRGTASGELLDTLGMDNAEKAIAFSVATDAAWRRLKRGLQNEMHIDVPGTGIAFTVPVGSIGGKTAFALMTRGTDFEKGEESVLKDTQYSLIVVICEQGYNGMVMECAKKAGAGGGTVIHAKGTGARSDEKFMGITLASEKDMIFIVTKTAGKNAIMEAVARDAGASTRAKAIAFSLPVTDTAGLRLTETEDAEADASGEEGSEGELGIKN
ncbi:MAG: P-II family nitrogen regulator [Clostridia bacterium]|nr:P-II family nitrogen regulator [Clostridia bacterium]